MPDEGSVDRSKFKIISLAIVGALFAYLFGYALSQSFIHPTTETLIVLGLGVVGWLVAIILTPFFIRSGRIAGIVSFFYVVAMWLGLSERSLPLVWLATAFLFIALFLSFFKGRVELHNAIRIKFFRITYRMLPIVMTGFSIFVALTVIGALSLTDLAISKTVFEFLFNGSAPVVSKFIPGFSFDVPVDEFLENLIRSRSPDGTPDYLIIQAVDEFKTNVNEELGAAIGGTEKIADAFYEIATAKLDALTGTSRLVTLGALGLLIFGLVKGVSFFLTFLIIIIGFIIYQILLALNIVHINKEPYEKEVIVV